MFKNYFCKTIAVILFVYAAVLGGRILSTGAHALLDVLTCTEETTGKIFAYERTEYEKIVDANGTAPIVRYSVGGDEFTYVSSYPQYVGADLRNVNVTVKYSPDDPSSVLCSVEMIAALILTAARAVVIFACIIIGKTLMRFSARIEEDYYTCPS